MLKTDRMKQAKERALKEDVERTKQATDAKGQGFVEYEIPPDEVDEKKVQRSLYTSFMTFLPYTNEYYEARAAEEEMDDLKKIRIEKVKVQDLYTMSKMGRHEEALETMMAETNYDFFYFNKMKLKMEKEGKFHFEMPNDRLLFASSDPMAVQNRLKKAIRQATGMLDKKMTNELARLSNVEGHGEAKAYDNSHPCSWRGKDSKTGDALKCENSRCRKPDPPPDPNNPRPRRTTGTTNEDYFAHCIYHLSFCINVMAHELGENVKIKVPNQLGFCTECYMQQSRKRPAPLSFETCPGIVRGVVVSALNANRVRGLIGGGGDGKGTAASSDGEKSRGSKKKRNPKICRWLAPSAAPALYRRYECSNAVHREGTEEGVGYCLWHVPVCIRHHAAEDRARAKILLPNVYGLCAMHYVAEYGKPPTETAFPYPGMIPRQSKGFWMHLQRHFGRPRPDPPSGLVARDYHEPEEPETWIQQVNAWAKIVLYKRRVAKDGKRSAITIQRWFRRYRFLNRHRDLYYTAQIPIRLAATITIQAAIRRCLASSAMAATRLKYNHAATVIQAGYRGYLTRLHLIIDWAARRISRFMKLLHFFKFRDAVILIMQLKRLFTKRMNCAMTVQRLYRGYRARWLVFYTRYWMIISRSQARRIQRSYRAVLARRKLVPWQPPGEKWVMDQVTLRLGRLLLSLYHEYAYRKALIVAYTEASQPLQRVIRGFLGRRGKQHLAYLRSRLRNCFLAGGKHGPAAAFISRFLHPSAKTLALGNHPYYSIPAHITVIRSHVNSRRQHLRSQQQLQQGAGSANGSVGSGGSAAAGSLTLQPSNSRSLHSNQPSIRLATCLPPFYQTFPEIHVKLFLPALAIWYEINHLILLQSEQDALLRRFKDPISNKIQLNVLETYLSCHPLPCRRHGRRICGDCAYHRHCALSKCNCTRYIKNSHHTHGICEGCSHAMNLHVLVPLQYQGPRRPKKKKKKTVILLLEDSKKGEEGEAVDGEMSTKSGNSSKKKAKKHAEDEVEEEMGDEEGGNGEEDLDDDDLDLDLAIGGDNDDQAAELRAVSLLEHLASLQPHHRAPDMSLPLGILGQPVESILLPPLTHDDMRRYQEEVTHEATLAAHAAQAILTTEEKVIRSLARNTMDGQRVLTNRSYWEQGQALSALQPMTTSSSLISQPIGQTMQHKTAVERELPAFLAGYQRPPASFLSVSYLTNNSLSQNLPTAKSHRFWQKEVSSVPNKRLEDYHEGFEHNLLMPVLLASTQQGQQQQGQQQQAQHQHLVYTKDGPQLYVNLLLLLLALDQKYDRDLEQHKLQLIQQGHHSGQASAKEQGEDGLRHPIHHDEPIFLQLVLDHIQLFERHWRKMVKDLRTGKLDSRLPVSVAYRTGYESRATPRPALAQRLDNVFRDLGFHKKVLGKDIEIRAYAEKRSAQEMRDLLLLSSAAGTATAGGGGSFSAGYGEVASSVLLPPLAAAALSRQGSSSQMMIGGRPSRPHSSSGSFISRPNTSGGGMSSAAEGGGDRGTEGGKLRRELSHARLAAQSISGSGGIGGGAGGSGGDAGSITSLPTVLPSVRKQLADSLYCLPNSSSTSGMSSPKSPKSAAKRKKQATAGAANTGTRSRGRGGGASPPGSPGSPGSASLVGARSLSRKSLHRPGSAGHLPDALLATSSSSSAAAIIPLAIEPPMSAVQTIN